MPTILNFDTIRESLNSKTSLQLTDILSFTQDDYDPRVIPIIETILFERGVSQQDIDVCKNSYGTLKTNLDKQPELRRQAGFFIRMCNYIFDHLVFFAICYVIQYFLAKYGLLDNSGRYEACCIIAYLGYYTITIWLFSATMGMLVVGLMVTDYNKKSVDFGTALLRGVCMLLNFFTLSIGHLIMIGDKKKQTLPDKWSKTLVVYRG